MNKKKHNYKDQILERNFQRELIKEIKKRLKDCIICKLDPNYKQGLPDLLILYKDHWAALEVKRSAHASHRPNQDYYVRLMDRMSFARFIFPENKETVLNEMEQTCKSRR